MNKKYLMRLEGEEITVKAVTYMGTSPAYTRVVMAPLLGLDS